MLNRETGQPEHVSTPWRAMMPTPRRHGLALLAALLASALAKASAQAPNDMSGEPVHVSTAMIALLAAVIAVFVFIAFSTIYLRHCTGYYDARTDFDGRAAVHLDRHTFVSRSRRQRGLDAEVVETFPTMRYAEAKALRVGKGGALECAVCLSEFEDEERLRLLPRCSHAFHPDCIGQWLASHVTCPVCRCNLDPNKQDTSSDEDLRVPVPAPQPNSISSETTSLRLDDSAQAMAVVIDVGTEEDEEERRREEIELQQIGSQRRAMRSRSGTPAQLARAHSTGRSFAVRLDRDMERFTLRLPEHVRREMVAAGEHSLQSLRGRQAGDGSRRGGRSGPLGRAARWQSLLVRTFSGKVSFFSASSATVNSDGGEVSSTSSSRARPKRVATVDAADVPDRGGIRLDRIGGSPSGAKAGTVPHEAADEEKAVAQQVQT
jgi:E3 ubiquitin-protein ligase ATL6/9/15/31/42/55